MITLIWILLFLALLTLLAYKRASLSVWTIAIAVFIVVIAEFSRIDVWGLTLLGVIFLIPAIILNILPLRRQLLTRPLLAFYQKVKPSVSPTEKEALTIGTVGWEGELFSGMPDWNKFLAYPIDQLSNEEKTFLANEVEQFCQLINNWKVNHNLFNLPENAWQFLKDKGFFGLIIPKKYGGKQFSALGHSAVITKISGYCNAAATIVGVPNSLGPAELLLEYGTEEQKDHYLPRLARGEEVPCFALTSPAAGSDAGSMPDHGIICKGPWQGQEVVGIRLQWDKRYITLAPIATLLGLAFKLYDPDHLLGDKKELGITCALIPTNLPGITTGRRHYPLNCAFPNGPTQGKDVFIPLDSIIGGPQMAGRGWHMLIERLSVGRAISLPSLSAGGAKVAMFTTGAYARIRKQFNISIDRFEGVEEALARIAGNTYIMDATRLFAVAAVDRGEQPAIPSAISKYNTTELARQVINDAMDIQGGKGICMGPHNYIAQVYEEAPIAITVEGANILTRCMIIFGQGVMRCHPYLFAEYTAAENPDHHAGLLAFDKAFFAHIGFIISNKARAFLLGISNGYFADAPGASATKRYYRQFTRFSAVFAFLSDVTLIYYGAKFKRKEHLSGRLADALSMLYLGSAVLKQFLAQGSPEEDLPLVEWSCQSLLYKLQNAVDDILRNLPNQFLAIALRIVVFPLGRNLKPPSDALGQKVATLISSPTASRTRLAAGAYLTPNASNVTGLINLALIKAIAAEEIEAKIHPQVRAGVVHGTTPQTQAESALALGIISAEEMQILREAEEAIAKVIAVDDFSEAELQRGL